MLSAHDDPLSGGEIDYVAKQTAGYSCSDITNLAREAALSPLRDCPEIKEVKVQDIRPISVGDFEAAMSKVRTSVSGDLLKTYEQWNVQFGDIS